MRIGGFLSFLLPSGDPAADPFRPAGSVQPRMRWSIGAGGGAAGHGGRYLGQPVPKPADAAEAGGEARIRRPPPAPRRRARRRHRRRPPRSQVEQTPPPPPEPTPPPPEPAPPQPQPAQTLPDLPAPEVVPDQDSPEPAAAGGGQARVAAAAGAASAAAAGSAQAEAGEEAGAADGRFQLAAEEPDEAGADGLGERYAAAARRSRIARPRRPIGQQLTAASSMRCRSQIAGCWYLDPGKKGADRSSSRSR